MFGGSVVIEHAFSPAPEKGRIRHGKTEIIHMLRLILPKPAGRPLRVLCLGAHADDIEIGAGGTLLSLLEQHPNASVHWVVFAAAGRRGSEAEASACAFLAATTDRHIELHDFDDGMFPSEVRNIKAIFESLKQHAPDLILTHVREDHHQDHRVIAELTANTFRDHLVLGYEIPKYDPDLGNPNAFCNLSPDHVEFKISALMKHFSTQHTRRWFSPETFLSMMRIRGVQAASPSGFAEGFYVKKLWF